MFLFNIQRKSNFFKVCYQVTEPWIGWHQSRFHLRSSHDGHVNIIKLGIKKEDGMGSNGKMFLHAGTLMQIRCTDSETVFHVVTFVEVMWHQMEYDHKSWMNNEKQVVLPI
jgi:hypothetical protein